MTKILYTPAEAAEVLGMSRTGFYRLLSSGDVPSVKIGALRRIPAAALDRYVQGLQQGPSATAAHADPHGPSAA